MARKTIAACGSALRDLLWTEARQRQAFTIQEIAAAVGVHPSTARSILGDWVKAGALRCSPGAWGQKRYKAVRRSVSKSVHTPRRHFSRANEALWIGMKMCKVFTADELVLCARSSEIHVSSDTAQRYCSRLARAGYLVVIAASQSGRCGRKAVYRFVRSTGPCAPMITREKQVFDPNLRKIVKPIKEWEDRRVMPSSARGSFLIGVRES